MEAVERTLVRYSRYLWRSTGNTHQFNIDGGLGARAPQILNELQELLVASTA